MTETENYLNDERLVQLACQGCEQSFETLYKRYSQSTYKICRRISFESATAEDLNQEVWLKVFSKISIFDPTRGKFGPWVTHLARNHVYDAYRAAKVRWRLYSPESDVQIEYKANKCLGFNGVDKMQVALDLQHFLPRAWAKLSSGEQQVIALSLYTGENHETIAELTKISLGTVKSRLRRGKAKLRTFLTDKGLTV